MRDWVHEARHGRYRLAGDPTDFEAALGRSRATMLLLALRGDRMIPPGAVDHLAHRIGGPVDRAVLPCSLADHESGFGHLDGARRSPGVVIGAVERWLAEQDD